MVDYVDHEARQMMADVLDALEEAGVNIPPPTHAPTSKGYGRGELVDLMVSTIAPTLDMIRDDRYEDGKRAGYIEGDDHGYAAAIEEANDAGWSDDRPWTIRLMEAGADVRAVGLPVLDWLDMRPDDVTMTMPEHEAYRLVRVLREAS